MNNDRNPLIKVYKHTLEHCYKEKFPILKSIKYSYLSSEYVDDVILSKANKFNIPAKIFIENMDSFDMARKIDNSNGMPLVLNLASHMEAGGGVGRGARAQEEDLFRKSNYAFVLPQNMYPLKMTEVIYSPLVHIVKDSNYNLLQSPVQVSCLAIAAIYNPPLYQSMDKEILYSQLRHKLIMENKIDMIFKVAIKHGHYDLVLGALGCGAFKNPPTEVAMMFKNSINKYKYYFKTINFAILSKQYDENYNIFKNILLKD